MPAKKKPTSVWFTTKGQVVIPAWLRREFHIENSTPAVVQSTPEGNLLKPVIKYAIWRLRGILKWKAGAKPCEDEWAHHKAEEMALEEGNYERRRAALDSFPGRLCLGF